MTFVDLVKSVHYNGGKSADLRKSWEKGWKGVSPQTVPQTQQKNTKLMHCVDDGENDILREFGVIYTPTSKIREQPEKFDP